MQDIPRNELLDLLAAGWKVRRKSWAKECTIGQSGGNTTTHWVDLLNDDWEGEPPQPLLRHNGKTLSVAVAYLKNGADFIRRKNWGDFEKYEKRHALFELSIEDILASDWEVWE